MERKLRRKLCALETVSHWYGAVENVILLTCVYLFPSDRYRFVELYYRRSETSHKGKAVPARVETVVIFLPDVWSCVSTRLEWDGMQLNYRKQLERRLKAAAAADQDQDETPAADEKASN